MTNIKNILNYPVKAMKEITLGPSIPVIVVPTEITVHLGSPDDSADNVTLPYIDYIKNVASSELYPTWPENALQANIHAITSMAMNRIHTEWYRSRGYNFDITNSTQFDQAYVHNRGIFDNVSKIADNVFHQYIVREGQILPYFAQFCDGRTTMCEGLHQWGTVDLANEGYSPLDILKYYYGDNIQIVIDAPIANVGDTYPGEPLQLGDSSLNVLRMQFSLDRISQNYPAIPRIQRIDGYFGESTQDAVREFQRVFILPVTGIIDEGTWYRIIRIFTAVTKLSELTGEGLLLSDIQRISSEVLLEGDVRPSVEIVQLALNILAAFYPTLSEVPITGFYDEKTRNAILEFQKIMGLTPTGAAGLDTLRALYNSTVGILETLPPEAVSIPYIRWTGVVYDVGHESPGVYLLQEMLSYISLAIPAIPFIDPSGVFDENTRIAVIDLQTMQGLEPTGIVNEQTWNTIVDVYRRQRYSGVPIII